MVDRAPAPLGQAAGAPGREAEGEAAEQLEGPGGLLVAALAVAVVAAVAGGGTASASPPPA